MDSKEHKDTTIYKVLIDKKRANKHLWKGKGDFHCKQGVISESDLLSEKTLLKTHTEQEFYSFPAHLPDKREKIKRGPQIITAKDIGYVITRAGITKEDIIVEAGGGSGSATSFFASICKEVHTYELREDHCEIITKNLNFLNHTNVLLQHGNLKDEIKHEKNYDLLFLDLPEPVQILQEDLSGLKTGKYIVCYLPSVYQIQELVSYIYTRADLYLEEVSETMVREWRVKENLARPQNRKEIDFTAFLIFIRKISEKE
jgi:tRNA (adenine57-N1/adenine58-N1)-methyltransferase